MKEENNLETVKKASLNSILFFTGQVLNKVFSFFAIILITNYLGKELIGKFTLALTYTVIFAYIVDFCTESIAVREYSKGKIKRELLVGNIILLKICLWIFTSVIVFVLIPVFENLFFESLKELKIIIFIFCFNLIISPKLPSIKTAFEMSFKANLKMKKPIFIDLFNSFMLFSLMLSAVLLKLDLIYVVILYTVSSLPGIIILGILAFKEVKPAFNIKFDLLKYVLRESFPIFIFYFLIRLSKRLDVFFLKRYWTDGDIGIYSAAFRLTEPLNFIPVAMVISLFPLMSSYNENSRRKLETVYHFGLKFICFIMFPIGVAGALYSSELINLFYVSQYSASSGPFEILILAQVFISVNVIINYFLVSVGKQRTFISVAIVLLFLSIFLNKIFVPEYGIKGAAAALAFVELAMMLSFVFISREFLKKFSKMVIFKLLLSVIPFFIVKFVFTDICFWIAILSGSLLYLVMVYLVKVFEDSELSYLIKAVKSFVKG